MSDNSDSTGQTDARAMMDTFASVGATRFNVTWTNVHGEKQSFRAGVPFGQLIRTIPGIIDYATKQQHNVIVRPHGPGVTFIQLDDLKADQLARVAPAVFLTLETSPGNFQAWVAMLGREDKDFARRLRKGTGADPTASGATRVAESLNFKDKYAPAFPRVMVRQVNPGRLAQAAELERLGLVADPEPVAQPLRISPARLRPSGSNRKWPSYERCLEGAPPSQSRPGDSRHSIADFTWCLIAADWGWNVNEIADRLMEESAKARENGPVYALKTARNATLAMERRDRQPKQQRAASHERR